MNQENQEAFASAYTFMARRVASRDIWFNLIWCFIAAVLWAVLFAVIPGGVWLGVANVVMFLISVFFGWSLSLLLKRVLTEWLAYFLAFLAWGFIFFTVRDLLVVLIEAAGGATGISL